MFAKDEQRERDRLKTKKNVMPILSSTINITFAIQGDPSGSWVRSKCSQNAQSFQSLMTSDPRLVDACGIAAWDSGLICTESLVETLEAT